MFTRRIRLLAGALVLGCLVLVGPSGPIDGPFASSLRDEITAEVVPNRVMTWNICNPCGENSADRAAEIATYAPQVIGMQEACVRDVERVRDYLKSRYGLLYHVEYGTVLRNWGRCGGLPWSPGAYGQAVLSAAPMTDLVHREYPDGGSEDRGYMAVTTTVGGQPVRVFNTHLAQRRQEAVRAAQTDVLAAEIAPYDRAIVIGDFNAVANAPELGAMWELATDVDAECQPSSFSGGCKPTTDWQSKFDYIFLRGISPLKHRVHPTRYSDHHMLYSDLDMSTAREGS